MSTGGAGSIPVGGRRDIKWGALYAPNNQVAKISMTAVDWQ